MEEQSLLSRAEIAGEGPPPLAPRKAFPGMAGALMLVVLVVVLQLVGGVVMGVAGTLLEVTFWANPLLLGVLSFGSMMAALAIALAWSPRPARVMLALHGFSLRYLLPAFLAMAGLHLVVSELGNLMLYLIPPPEGLQLPAQLLLGDGEAPVQAAITLVVLAPIGEELLFRGAIVDGLTVRRGPVAAMVVSGVLFGLIHLTPWQGVPIIVIGVVLAWWRLATGSVWLCVYGHAINNALVFIATMCLPVDIPGYNAQPAEGMAFQPWWLTTAGCTLTLAGMLGMGAVFRGTSRRDGAM
ncbi:MAG: CPBP family intramembrane glutamic endopeptidase [Candidatus Hydrogenedentota bacterium]